MVSMNVAVYVGRSDGEKCWWLFPPKSNIPCPASWLFLRLLSLSSRLPRECNKPICSCSSTRSGNHSGMLIRINGSASDRQKRRVARVGDGAGRSISGVNVEEVGSDRGSIHRCVRPGPGQLAPDSINYSRCCRLINLKMPIFPRANDPTNERRNIIQ